MIKFKQYILETLEKKYETFYIPAHSSEKEYFNRKNISEKDIINYINKYGAYFLNIPKNKITPAVELALIRIDPHYIKNIKNPTKEMQLLAISLWPGAIQYIKNPSDEIKLLAIKMDISLIKYLNPLSKNLQEEAIKIHPITAVILMNPIDPDVQMKLVRNRKNSFLSMKNPTQEVTKYVIRKKPILIKMIDSPSLKIQEIAFFSAMNNFPKIFQNFINNPQKNHIKEFIDKNPHLIFPSNLGILNND